MLSRFCGACRVLAGKLPAWLECAPELSRRDANHAPKDLREMARTGVTDVERDFDEATRGFADELLRARDPLPHHELQRRRTCALLEHARKMERAEFDELG